MKGKKNTVDTLSTATKKLREYIALSLDKGQQLLAHCNGDAAAEQYISQFEKELEKREKRQLSGSHDSCAAGTGKTA